MPVLIPLERACKVLCQDCDEEVPLRRDHPQYGNEVDARWWHVGDTIRDCRAARLRDLAETIEAECQAEPAEVVA